MLNSRELMTRHVETLYTWNLAGRMLLVHEHEGGPAPRFFLGRTAAGSVRRYRHDIHEALRRDLEKAGETLASTAAHNRSLNADVFSKLLEQVAPVCTIEAGPVFCFPDLPEISGARVSAAVVLVTRTNTDVLLPLLPPRVPDVERSPPVVAIVASGEAVAVCASVRRTAQAHEAGVEVDVAHRGRGYALQVVTAWARAVRSLRAEPLYSTSWDNEASKAVAHRLGLVEFGNELAIT